MDSMKVQVDVKNNAQDLQNYFLDLKAWESEMKRKEETLKLSSEEVDSNCPPPRNKIKKLPSKEEKIENVNKISAYDYKAWDKFDVDKACEKIDNPEVSEDVILSETTVVQEPIATSSRSSHTSEPVDPKLIDEAFYEKNLGNNHVQKGNWKEAIKCYTRAITCDANNPIFYANRALCFLKMKEYKAAETDSTTAIQLDETYVKAFQRRALVRTILGQLQEAISDYQEILKIDPSNKSASQEIEKITKKLDSLKIIPNIAPPATIKTETFNPKNIFQTKKTASVTTSLEAASTSKKFDSKATVNEKSISTSQTFNPKNIFQTQKKGIQVKQEQEAELPIPVMEKHNITHQIPGISERVQPSEDSIQWSRNFKDKITVIQSVVKPPHLRSKKPLLRLDVSKTSNIKQELEKSPTKEAPLVTLPNTERSSTSQDVSTLLEDIICVPKTSVQFQNIWKKIQHEPEFCYKYLKNIPGELLPSIFQNSLESNLFGSIIKTLVENPCISDQDLLHSILFNLTKVGRFGALAMFMTSSEKEAVKKCLHVLREFPSNQVTLLEKLYEI